ncbi:MAG: hypothetical protein AAFU55_10740, partial [Pseudomonadota bacterium]
SCCALAARAHELRPALAEVSFPEDRFQIVFLVNLEALLADVGPGHDNVNDSLAILDYLRYREMPPEGVSSEYFAFENTFLDGLAIRAGDVELERDTVSLLVPAVGDLAYARESVISVGGPVPEGVTEISVGWDANFGSIVVRTVADDLDEGFSAFLIGGDVGGPIRVEGPAGQNAVSRFFNGLWQWAVTGE